MFFRLAHRNDVNFIIGFRMGNHDCFDTEQAHGIPTLFGIVGACILNRCRGSIENLYAVGKIQTVLFQVGLSLRFVPTELHGDATFVVRLRRANVTMKASRSDSLFSLSLWERAGVRETAHAASGFHIPGRRSWHERLVFVA
ncbi:MAG: hypothetical protein ACRER2_13945 [Methylococcales bacterium]